MVHPTGVVNPVNYAAAQLRITRGLWVPDLIEGRMWSMHLWDWLRGTPDAEGYRFLTMRRDGRTVGVRLHRVLWESAHGPVPLGLVCNHLDGDKGNNRLSNLEMTTQSANRMHALALGLARTRYGAESPAAKLTLAEVKDIRSRIAAGEVQKDIAEDYGVAQTTISGIKHRRHYGR